MTTFSTSSTIGLAIISLLQIFLSSILIMSYSLISSFMCDIFASLVRGDNNRTEELLISFRDMLSHMQDEPSQLNFVAAMTPDSPFVSSSSLHSPYVDASDNDDSSDDDYIDSKICDIQMHRHHMTSQPRHLPRPKALATNTSAIFCDLKQGL
ncbi:hypothetical protein F5878DRAFT_721031 [Lentinula raphanica]|uniref:Uncharacterized protein n=1 Tax=Lentinula raphanica TaxID=153919 RepID=A0AA38UJE5_9AGAR|nr:hypothetical protein F5878DRAFT_721031 [Lentinula raphanica]